MAAEPAKKISLAFGKKPLVKSLAKTTIGIKRPAATLHDSDDEDDGSAGRHQEISAFDQASGGAVTSNGTNKAKSALVIPALPNHDRLEYGRKKRQRSDLPQEQADIVIVKKEVTFGLSLPESKPINDSGDIEDSISEGKKEDAIQPKTEDQIALDALLGNGISSTKSIPLIDEDEVFRRDMGDAVEVPTLDQYLAIPPSEFGAACLRGMGWKDTETLGTASAASATVLKPRPTERRPALLGVGAKPSAALGIEIGEWGKAARGGQKGKEQQGYNPVVLKNKKTGEVLTEQELKSKVAQQDQPSNALVFDDADDRRSTRDSDRHDDRSRDRHREKYNSDSKRDRHSKLTRADHKQDEQTKKRNYDEDRYKDKDAHRDKRDDRKYRDDYKYDREGRRRDDSKRYDNDRKENHRSKDYRRDRHDDDRYHASSSSRKDRDRSDRDYDSSRRRRD